MNTTRKIQQSNKQNCYCADAVTSTWMQGNVYNRQSQMYIISIVRKHEVVFSPHFFLYSIDLYKILARTKQKKYTFCHSVNTLLTCILVKSLFGLTLYFTQSFIYI